jgi:hypothetical protein
VAALPEHALVHCLIEGLLPREEEIDQVVFELGRGWILIQQVLAKAVEVGSGSTVIRPALTETLEFEASAGWTKVSGLPVLIKIHGFIFGELAA